MTDELQRQLRAKRPTGMADTIVRLKAADRLDRYEAALREIAGPITTNAADYEGLVANIADTCGTFARKQIAREALEDQQ